MARLFNGTTEQMAATLAVNTNTLTVGGWVNIVTLGSFLPIFESRTTNLAGLILSGASGNPVTGSWLNTEFSNATGLTITTGKWTYVAMTVAPTVMTTWRRTLGGALGSFAATQTNGAQSETAWDFCRDQSPTRWLNATLAEWAVWTATLVQDEIQALANGALPRQIRPGSIHAYWPIYGLQSPEPDLSGNARNATVTGSALANHAPVAIPDWGRGSLTEPVAGAAAPIVYFLPVIAAQSPYPIPDGSAFIFRPLASVAQGPPAAGPVVAAQTSFSVPDGSAFAFHPLGSVAQGPPAIRPVVAMQTGDANLFGAGSAQSFIPPSTLTPGVTARTSIPAMQAEYPIPQGSALATRQALPQTQSPPRPRAFFAVQNEGPPAPGSAFAFLSTPFQAAPVNVIVYRKTRSTIGTRTGSRQAGEC